MTKWRNPYGLLAASALSLALTGCVDESATTASTAPSAADQSAAAPKPRPKAVSPERAIALFDAVCFSTANAKFDGAKTAMAANNVTVPSPDMPSVIQSVDEDLSFRVAGSGDEAICSMVFGSRDTALAMFSAVTHRYGAKGEILGGAIALQDPRSGRYVIFRSAGRSENWHNVFDLAVPAKKFVPKAP